MVGIDLSSEAITELIKAKRCVTFSNYYVLSSLLGVKRLKFIAEKVENISLL